MHPVSSSRLLLCDKLLLESGEQIAKETDFSQE